MWVGCCRFLDLDFVIPAKAGTHLSSWFKVRNWGELGPRFRGDDDWAMATA